MGRGVEGRLRGDRRQHPRGLRGSRGGHRHPGRWGRRRGLDRRRALATAPLRWGTPPAGVSFGLAVGGSALSSSSSDIARVVSVSCGRARAAWWTTRRPPGWPSPSPPGAVAARSPVGGRTRCPPSPSPARRPAGARVRACRVLGPEELQAHRLLPARPLQRLHHGLFVNAQRAILQLEPQHHSPPDLVHLRRARQHPLGQQTRLELATELLHVGARELHAPRRGGRLPLRTFHHRPTAGQPPRAKHQTCHNGSRRNFSARGRGCGDSRSMEISASGSKHAAVLHDSVAKMKASVGSAPAACSAAPPLREGGDASAAAGVLVGETSASPGSGCRRPAARGRRRRWRRARSWRWSWSCRTRARRCGRAGGWCGGTTGRRGRAGRRRCVAGGGVPGALRGRPAEDLPVRPGGDGPRGGGVRQPGGGRRRSRPPWGPPFASTSPRARRRSASWSPAATWRR